MAILSIQSHVVYGAVGNTAAVFPLQRLGNEVWAVNTVEFSNHPGYGMYKGRIFDASLIDDLISALDERDVLNNCSAVLSGYLGAPDIAMSIFKAVKKVKAANPSALFACDPVMGDTGKGFYVHKDIPAMFKTHLIPHSDIITPNQFELNVLTNNIDTSTIENAVKAINILHAMGPKIVLVTSYEYKNSDKDNVNMLVSDTKNIFMITTPRLALSEKLCGGGDLTSAIFLSTYLQTHDAALSIERTASSVFGIMKNSFEAGSTQLLLASAQEELIRPAKTFRAVSIPNVC